MAFLTVAKWAASLQMSRQAGHQAVRRCNITVTDDGLVDDEIATLLYRRHTRARVRVRPPAQPAARTASANDSAVAPLPSDPTVDRQLEDLSALGLLALSAIDGKRFDLVEHQLREAIAALPAIARERLALPLEVWDALTAGAAHQLAIAGVPFDTQLDDVEADAAGEVWCRIAAGELQLTAATLEPTRPGV